MKLSKILLLPTLCLLCSCSGNTPTDDTIVVGASSTPHAEILEVAKPLVEAKGYKLSIKVFNDYVTPNLSLDSGDLDANYFQHTPYLEDFNATHGTKLVGVCKVHFEPMGIYSKKHTTLENGLKVVVPNDKSNHDRAVELMESLGFSGNVIEATAETLPALLDDVDYAIINGNYALSSGITDKCLATESSDSEIAQRNANIIAVKDSYKEYKFVSVLKECILSETVKSFISYKYGASVKAVF